MGCNQILDRYIEQLIETSTPQAPAWNIEKIRAGKENTWNYIDGCMIKALIELYEITGEQRYLTFADDYIDFFVQDDGTIKHYNPQDYNLDNVNAGKTLYKLYDLVGKPKYRAAMDTISRQLETQPRTKEGVFWHKAVYPNQIWLDGMYMAQPFYMQYELSFHNRRACSDSFHMFQVVHDLMRNPLNGLYYHAYDASRKQFWCDPVTGLSANFWLRAEGWFAMALIDTWELMPPSMSAEKDEIRKMFHDLIDAMLPYQDEKTGMWHQVINLPNIAPNYLEESGSAIFANAIMKGVRLGVLGERYYQYGRRAFDGICETCLSEHDGQLALDNICLVAGLGNTAHREGTFDYYMSEPVVKNDAKGVAPLVLAYIETMHHDKLAGKRDPLAPSGVCSIEDPFGGYTPGINDRQQLMDNFAEYEACLNFAQMLGGCPVGTETGRPNAQNRVADDRMTDEALDAFADGLARVCERAEAVGGQILIEPGWNETVNTPDRCREVLERVSSPSLGVIYDPVSLLHPSVVDEAQEITARMLYLCGSKIRVLHAKDFEVVDNEDEAGWCDGTGSRLVCHGVGETGRYDFEPVVAWAAAACPGIPCVVENSVPATAADCLATLEHMSARCGASHREL